MKFLFLLLISLPIMAQEFTSKIEEIDKETQAIKQSKQLNKRYKNLATFCSSQNYELDLKNICEVQFKAYIQNEFKERMQFIIAHDLETANKELTDALTEQKCVSYFRKKLEDSNKTYLPEDTCQQLKEKFEAP